MNLLIKDLRLHLAQFNSFLIEHYLLKIQKHLGYPEYLLYFFDSFHSLSEGVGALGIALGKNDVLSPEDVFGLQKALVDATTITYLVERSTDITDLTETVKRIQSENLNNIIEHIKAYSVQFPTNQYDIDEEISMLIADNANYFNPDNSLKYSTFSISTEDAAAYITEHSTIRQVKIAFKNVPALHSYFESISPDDLQSTPADHTKTNVLNTLTIILIAFGYLEPFFEKDENTASKFNKLVKELSVMQSLI